SADASARAGSRRAHLPSPEVAGVPEREHQRPRPARARADRGSDAGGDAAVARGRSDGLGLDDRERIHPVHLFTWTRLRRRSRHRAGRPGRRGRGAAVGRRDHGDAGGCAAGQHAVPHRRLRGQLRHGNRIPGRTGALAARDPGRLAGFARPPDARVRVRAGRGSATRGGSRGRDRGPRVTDDAAVLAAPLPDEGSAADRFLRIFSDVRPGEGATVLLLTLNLFLLMVGYYIFKVVREPLVLVGGGAEMKSYAAAAQALTLMGFVPLYSWFSSRVNRMRLLMGVIFFFIACIEALY